MPRSNPPLRVAIVGCGKIADCHVEALRRIPEQATVVAACDREPLMAEQLARRHGIDRAFSNFERMLAAARPDVVHVATPPASHLEIASAAIDAGKAVYVEKPLAPSYEQSRQLLRHAERAGVELTVGYTYLFDPPALVMRRLIEEGLLGDTVEVESRYGYDLAGSYGRAVAADAGHWVRALPGGLLHNTIDHLINKLTEFIDAEDPGVLALGKRLSTAQDQGMHDELRVLLDGRRVSGYASFSAHARPNVHACVVRGTRNTIQVDYVGRTVTLLAAPSLPSALGRLLPAFGQAWSFACEGARNLLRFAGSRFHFLDGLFVLVERFYRGIREGSGPPIAYRDILWVARLVERILAQLHGPPARVTRLREVGA